MELAKAEKIIRGKRILIVDDEQDVLDTLIEILSMCKIDPASSFEQAKELLENGNYDFAVLDIMGVSGYDLLEITRGKNIPTLMLTAYALSEDNLNKSAQKGADYFVPKEEMRNIALFVADVIEAKASNKNPWIKWYDRLCSFFDDGFGGTDWREKERKFLEKHIKSVM